MVSSEIGAEEAKAVMLFFTLLFYGPFTLKIDNYWADTVYSPFSPTTSSLEAGSATDPKEKKVVTATMKALRIARSKSQSIWSTWVLTTLYFVALTFLVPSFYWLLPKYADHNEDGTRFTTNWALFFLVVILDKWIPSALHYYTFENMKWLSFVYLALTWLVSLATMVMLFVYSNTNYPGGFFIPYFLWNTLTNITTWTIFLPEKSYDLDNAKLGSVNTPSNIANQHYGSYYQTKQ